MLACNTFSLSVSEIASVTYRAKKILGMSFTDPVREMKILEITCGRETDAPTLAAVCEVARRMGKKVVVLEEAKEIVSSSSSVI